MLWAAATLLLGFGVAAAIHARQRRTHPAIVAAPPFPGSDVRAPAGVRIKVEVFNATRTRGLGRRAMLYLRDQGFDVVTLGTVPEPHDTTIVIDRSGHPEWAELVARALGAARVQSRPDSSRFVDLSVLLGSTWRPPAQPFYP